MSTVGKRARARAKKPFIFPFQFGDVVVELDHPLIEHYIHEVQTDEGGSWEYSTNRGAWYAHDNLKLVRKADEKSLRAMALVSLQGDDEDQSVKLPRGWPFKCKPGDRW
jgi:hypothetical protein